MFIKEVQDAPFEKDVDFINNQIFIVDASK